MTTVTDEVTTGCSINVQLKRLDRGLRIEEIIDNASPQLWREIVVPNQQASVVNVDRCRDHSQVHDAPLSRQNEVSLEFALDQNPS